MTEIYISLNDTDIDICYEVRNTYVSFKTERNDDLIRFLSVIGAKSMPNSATLPHITFCVSQYNWYSIPTVLYAKIPEEIKPFFGNSVTFFSSYVIVYSNIKTNHLEELGFKLIHLQ